MKICRNLAVWLKNNHIDTRALTDTDWTALEAFVHLMSLWGKADKPQDVLGAAAICVHEMQEKTRHVAKRAIPCALDWEHEHFLWPLIEAKLEGVSGRAG